MTDNDKPLGSEGGCGFIRPSAEGDNHTLEDVTVESASLNISAVHIEPDTDKDLRGAVPNGELRDLLARWRESADCAENEGILAESDGINGCADELEALIEDHTDA